MSRPLLVAVLLLTACTDKDPTTTSNGLTMNPLPSGDGGDGGDDDDDGDASASASDGGTTVSVDPTTGPGTATQPTTDLTTFTTDVTTGFTSEISGITAEVTSEPSTEFTSDGSFTSNLTLTSLGDTTATTDTTDTDGGAYGQCGWNTPEKYYDCAASGGTPGLADPEGISPIECPDGLTEGAACTDDGPVDSIGCCTPAGVLFFCDTQTTNTIYRQDCG